MCVHVEINTTCLCSNHFIEICKQTQLCDCDTEIIYNIQLSLCYLCIKSDAVLRKCLKILTGSFYYRTDPLVYVERRYVD